VAENAGEIRPLFEPVPHLWANLGNGFPNAPAFTHNGRTLLTIVNADDGRNQKLAWWDARTGKSLAQQPRVPRTVTPIHNYLLASGPDGFHFTAAGHSGAHIWDTSVDPPRVSFVPHRNYVTSAAFSPDGKTLLTASEDRVGQLWSVANGQPLGPPLVHQASLNLAAFAGSGQLLATAQEDGLVRVWAPPRGDPKDRQLPLGGSPTFAALSPDGEAVIATGAGWWNGTLRQ